MADLGHELTDKELKKLEKRMRDEYYIAQRDTRKKLQEYLEQMEEGRKKQKALLDAGKISKQEYKDWCYRHAMVGQRWKDMLTTLAEDYHHTNEIALAIARQGMPDIFALNMNYATWDLEHKGRIDTGFTLYNHDTAAYLLKDQRQLMPGPSTKKLIEIAANKDMQWNMQKIQSAVLQGVLQGESPYDVAKRLQQVADMDYRAAVRYARTMTTSAQNAGRYEAFRRAKRLGVDLTIEWQATLDGRTRHEHRMMHGQRTDVDKPFHTPDGYTIYYPADCSGASDAPQSEIWNCRCTLLSWVKGFEGDTVKSSPKMEGKSFEEWQKERPVYDKTKNASGSRQRREKRERLAEAQNVDRKPVENPQVVSWVKPIVGNHTREQDIMATNPNYLTGGTEYHMNCQRCVTAYEARRRGYDVTALPCYDRDDKYGRGRGFTLPYEKGDRKADPLWYSAGLQFSEAKSFTKEQSLVTINTLMESYGNGSRAIVDGFWTDSGTGHVFVAEYVGGKVQFFDPQNGDMDCSHYFDLMSPATISLFRVDDLPFTAAIKDVFKNDII